MSTLLTIYEVAGFSRRPIAETDNLEEARQICRGELAARDEADAVIAFDAAGHSPVMFERGPGGEIVDFSFAVA